MTGTIKIERYFIDKGIWYTMYEGQRIYKWFWQCMRYGQCPKYKMLQYAMFSNIASMIQKPPKDEKPPLVVPTSLLPQNYHMYNFCFVFSQKPWTKASGSIHASLFMIASNEKLFVTYLPPLGYMSRLVQSNYSLYLDLVAIYTIKQKQ